MRRLNRTIAGLAATAGSRSTVPREYGIITYFGYRLARPTNLDGSQPHLLSSEGKQHRSVTPLTVTSRSQRWNGRVVQPVLIPVQYIGLTSPGSVPTAETDELVQYLPIFLSRAFLK